MIITKDNIDLGFRFKVFATLYEVVAILNFNNDVILLNTETKSTFNFVKRICRTRL